MPAPCRRQVLRTLRTLMRSEYPEQDSTPAARNAGPGNATYHSHRPPSTHRVPAAPPRCCSPQRCQQPLHDLHDLSDVQLRAVNHDRVAATASGACRRLESIWSRRRSSPSHLSSVTAGRGPGIPGNGGGRARAGRHPGRS